MSMKISAKDQIKNTNIKDLPNLNQKGIKLIQQLSGKSTSNMSTDEIMKLTHGEA